MELCSVNFICHVLYTLQYIIIKNGILRFNSFNSTFKQRVYFTYTPSAVYGLIFNEINGGHPVIQRTLPNGYQ